MSPRERFMLAWERASLASVREGLAWYPSAREVVLGAARQAGGAPLGPDYVTRTLGVTAVLSPRLPWRFNVSDVHSAVMGRWEHMHAIGINREKARRILAAPEGEAWQRLVTGPKVSAFFAALCGDIEAVCLDVHMIRLAGLDPARGLRAKGYAALAADLRAVAHEVSVPPRDLQAVLWCHARGRGT